MVKVVTGFILCGIEILTHLFILTWNLAFLSLLQIIPQLITVYIISLLFLVISLGYISGNEKSMDFLLKNTVIYRNLCMQYQKITHSL